MIYKVKPENFNPKFEIVSCFVEHDGNILLVHRHNHKSQGGRWGLPAGKVDPGERLKQAIIREIKEETSLDIPEGSLAYFNQIFVRHGDYDFIFHTFFTKLGVKSGVTINPNEHQEFTWKTPLEVLAMKKEEIVEDLDYVCKLFYKIG